MCILSTGCKALNLWYNVYMRKTAHGISTATAKNLTSRDYVRELVRTRDKYTCQMCGKLYKPAIHKKRFDVHHLNGLCGKKSKGVDRVKDIAGLITLCHKCHYRHHEFTHKAQYANRGAPPQKTPI